MKKAFIMAFCLLAIGLTACGHKHTMTEATCEAPAICSECGYTEGEPLAHNLTEATCETPATCSKCGYTEGEALRHNLVEPSNCTSKGCPSTSLITLC